MIREQIMSALVTLVEGSAGFVSVERRLRHWGKVAGQPAAFVLETGNQYQQHGGSFPPIRELEAEIVIYASTDPQAPPGTTLNALLDAVEQALMPPPGQAQTLGGLVAHCWIGGDDGQKARIEIFEGHLGEQAAAVIPIRILVP